jgi:general secretion pathway protein G
VPGGDGRPYAVYSLGADGKRGGEGPDADIGLLPAQ